MTDDENVVATLNEGNAETARIEVTNWIGFKHQKDQRTGEV